CGGAGRRGGVGASVGGRKSAHAKCAKKSAKFARVPFARLCSLRLLGVSASRSWLRDGLERPQPRIRQICPMLFWRCRRLDAKSVSTGGVHVEFSRNIGSCERLVVNGSILPVVLI